MRWNTSYQDYNVGFRCASDPVAISSSYSSSSGRSGGGNTITIGSVSDGKVYQSANVGDTSTYDFSAYVYDNTSGSEGGTVSSSIAQLFYNGSTISTTYTNAGSGWWKLSGTLTGANESREYGLLVKAGKTIIADDFSLTSAYETSGSLTSNIFDSAYTAGAAWGTLTYTATTPTNTTVTVKARTDSSSDMSGATAFASCDAITSGSDISSNNCVTDSHRYIQYQVTLSTSDTTATPTFSDISINFATYDNTAPSISLTALSPDPNSDNTPILAGTATEAIGTVSNVEFQMDGTAGSWTVCTADDGAFDEASETFTCTPSALSDGSHTIYVRATDSNSNTTANANAATDTFVIDTTSPTAPSLDSPSDKAYTQSSYPTFKFKKTTDATSGINKYEVKIDQGKSNEINLVGNISHNGTDTDTEDKNIDYNGEYISVYSKESSKALSEGTHTWRVIAYDNAGNNSYSERTIYIDKTKPKIESVSFNSLGEKNNYLIITNKKPAITIKTTDNLALEKLEVSLYKQHFFLGAETDKTLLETRKLNSLEKGITSKDFTFSPTDEFSYGKYLLKATLYDKAGNTENTKEYYFQVLSPDKALALLNKNKKKETIKEIRKKQRVSIPELEKKAVLRREKQAGELKKLTQKLKIKSEKLKTTAENLKLLALNSLNFLKNLTLSLSYQTTKTIASLLQSRVAKRFTAGVSYTVSNIGRKRLAQLQQTAGKAIQPIIFANNLIFKANKRLLLSQERVKQGIRETHKDSSERMRRIGKGVRLAVRSFQKPAIKTKNFTERVRKGTIIALSTFNAYVFDPNPTKIEDVYIDKLGKNYVIIGWDTNHYTKNNKVNYGENLSFGKSIYSNNYAKHHRIKITNLKPNTKYYFEVMSQNKNYVYDSDYSFVTNK